MKFKPSENILKQTEKIGGTNLRNFLDNCTVYSHDSGNIYCDWNFLEDYCITVEFNKSNVKSLLETV